MSRNLPAASQAAPSAGQSSLSKGGLRSGRILSTLLVLILLFDGITKVIKVRAALVACAQLGLSENLMVAMGITLLVCTIRYVIPRSAIRLTGYLGGAVSIPVRVGNPLFGQTLFPVYFGAFVWLGLYLREGRLRSLIPLRS